MKEKIAYYVFIFIFLLVCLGLTYHTAHAGMLDWFKKNVPAPVIKTLDSEIDRLSIKYEVSSSTVRSIIKCESTMYGEAINHNRLPDGTVWSSDWGYWQINDYFHEATMAKLGLDIHNQWDSLEYGFILLKEQGTKPWYASATCHKK